MKKIEICANSFKPIKVLSLLLLFVVLTAVVFATGLLFALPQAQATFNDDFRVHTWGHGAFGQLGLGYLSTPFPHPNHVPIPQADRNAPVMVPGIADIYQWRHINAIGNTTFAVSAEGRMFSWGGGSHGQLGLNNTENKPLAQEVTTLPAGVTEWREVAGGSNHTLVLDQSNRLFGTGSNVNGQLGLGPDVPNTEVFIPIPMPDGVTSWRDVAAGQVHTLALDQTGRLVAFGTNAHGQLGLDNSVPAIGNFVHTPTLVPFPDGVTEWRSVIAGGNSSGAITTDGRLFIWGQAIPTGASTHIPDPISLPAATPPVTGWASVQIGGGFTVRHVTALTNCGRLFSWGQNANGVTGQNTTAGNTYDPTQIGNRSNWAYLAAGTDASAALDNRGRLYAWGNNAQGQLGIAETGGNRSVPTRVGSYYWNSISVGERHMIAISAPELTYEFDLTKALQKPYGTPRRDLTFQFTMVAHSFNNNPSQEVIDATFPTTPVDSRNLTRTITINNASESNLIVHAAGNIVELRETTNLLEGIEFSRRGVYSWIISEVPNTTGVTPPSSVVYSQAQYELRVYVRQEPSQFGEFYVYAITVHRLRNADGTTPTNGREKVGMNDEAEITFTNRYTRLTAANQHLNVTKYIEGNFANTDETFSFTATLNRHSFCTLGPITARVFNQNNVEVATHSFTVANPTVANITLSHNWRLVFDPITIGSSFVVIEAACPVHIARVRVYSHAHPTIPQLLENTVVGQPRTTNTHIIGANTNAANFINAHQYMPPTGLVLGAPTYVVVPLFTAGIALAATFARRARKRIEDMPAMH